MELPKAGQVTAAINVTPLVDVVLVLLIIFMVVTPLLQRGPAVQLPKTTNPATKPESQKEILVGIDHNKMYTIVRGQGTEMGTEADFPARIGEAFRLFPDNDVVIKGDARLTYGDVKKAMLEVKKAGFSQVGLITERQERNQ